MQFIWSPNENEKVKICDILQIEIEESESSLKGMTNVYDADEDDIVIEMDKYASIVFQKYFIILCYQRLLDGYVDESWHTTVL